MTDFTITEDFPRSEIELDARFQNRRMVTSTCFNKNGLMAFLV